MKAVRLDMELTIDPRARGRQHGVLRVAAPRAGDRWACLEIPVVQIGSGSGPIVTLLAEGGEPACTHALAELARTLDPSHLAGTVRVIPSLFPARFATLERIELQTLRTRLLDTLAASVMDGSGLVLELGDAQGGAHRWCDAAVLCCNEGAWRGPAALESAMVAFGASFSLRVQEATGGQEDDPSFQPDIYLGEDDWNPEPALEQGTIASRCHRLGIAHLSTRGHDGDSAADIDSLLIGCRNVLVQRDVLDVPLTLRSSRQLIIRLPEALLRAPGDGLLEPRMAPGREVQAGDALARLLDPARPTDEPHVVRAPRAGIVAAMHRSGPVTRGDGIVLLAEEMQD